MDTNIEALIETHVQIWNEKDLLKRNALIAEVYADDIEMVDRHFIANGRTEINGFVDGLQQKSPEYRFTHIKQIDTHHNIARLYWQFGSTTNPDAVTGMDVFVLEKDKVQKLYVFVDSDK